MEKEGGSERKGEMRPNSETESIQDRPWQVGKPWDEVQMGDQSRSENPQKNYNPRVLGVPAIAASVEIWYSWGGKAPDPGRQEVIKIREGLAWFLRELLEKDPADFPVVFQD